MISFVGDTGVDPFWGTATTMVVTLKHGRNSLGVELDRTYCKMAASRLMDENTSMFGKAKLQIEFRPQSALVEVVAIVNEAKEECRTRNRKKAKRA